MIDYEELINQLNERVSQLKQLGLDWDYYRPSDARLDIEVVNAIKALMRENEELKAEANQ